ncbi:MAG TPA: hypothetical protein PK239_07600 [Chitinophagales bacterium]|nr:hypothetical protein [Chitinophagales bacterium]
MKPSNDLFRLIKSLNKNEKGYFKKFVQLHSLGKNTDYLLLFDEIDKQPDEYDEAKIVKKFKNKPLLKHLSATKAYLFDLILKSLRSYYEQTIWSFKNEAQAQNIEVLIEKGLHELAEKQAEKQETTNREHDDKLGLLRILKIRNNYISTLKMGKLSYADNLQKTISVLNSYKQGIEYALLYLEIFDFLNTQVQIRTEEQQREWYLFMQNSLLQHLPDDATFNTCLYFYLTHFAYHAITQNSAEQGRYIRLVIKHWDAHPHIKKTQILPFLSALNNYFVYCYGNGLIEEFEHYLNQQTLSNATQPIQAVWFTNTNMWNMAIYHLRHSLPECIALADNIYSQITHEYAGIIKPSAEIALLSNCCIFYIYDGQFSKALDIIQLLLDTKHKNIRKDLLVSFRIWYLIVHLELQNDLLLESAIRAVKRYAQNQEYYFEYEILFMRFFNKYLHTPTGERQELYANLMHDIEELEAGSEIDRNFIQREATHKLWVKHKITGQNLFNLARNG